MVTVSKTTRIDKYIDRCERGLAEEHSTYLGRSYLLDFRIAAKALRSIFPPSSFGSFESCKPVSLPPPASVYQGDMTVKLKI